MLNIGWWSLLTLKIINIPVFRCIYAYVTFNALFSPGHRWLMSSIVLSKDLWSIVYRVQGTQTQELLFFTQRMWSDSTEVRQPGRLRRTNFLEIAIICDFWLSITNMCDMSQCHIQGGHGDTEPQLSVSLFIVLNFTTRCKNVTRLSPPVYLWHLRSQMATAESVSRV